jgi:hypothetical protein
MDQGAKERGSKAGAEGRRAGARSGERSAAPGLGEAASRIERIVDWNALSEDLQLLLSREALRRAVETVAGQAELLAVEMEEGRLADLGGAEALRLLAAVARATGETALGGAVAGHA